MHRLLRSLPCLHRDEEPQRGFYHPGSFQPLKKGTSYESPAKIPALVLPSPHEASCSPISSRHIASPGGARTQDRGALTLGTIPEASEHSYESSSLVQAASSHAETSSLLENAHSSHQEAMSFGAALELLENDIARRHRLMVADRQRGQLLPAPDQVVGSRGRYRQQALSSRASSSEASSSLISLGGYAQGPGDMLAALDEARLDAEEEVGRVRKQLHAAELRVQDLEFASLQADQLSSSRAEELQRVSATLKLTSVQNDVLNRALCRALDDLGMPQVSSPAVGTPMPSTLGHHAGRTTFPTPDGSVHCGLTPSGPTPASSILTPGTSGRAELTQPMPMRSLSLAGSPPSQSSSCPFSSDTAAESSSGVISLTRCSSPSALPSSSYGHSSLANPCSDSAASVSASTPNLPSCPRSTPPLRVLLPNQAAADEPRQPWVGPLPHAPDMSHQAQPHVHATTSMADWLPHNIAAVETKSCNIRPHSAPRKQHEPAGHLQDLSTNHIMPEILGGKQYNSAPQEVLRVAPTPAVGLAVAADHGGEQEILCREQQHLSFQGHSNSQVNHVRTPGSHSLNKPSCSEDAIRKYKAPRSPQRQLNPFQDLTNRQMPVTAIAAKHASSKPAKPSVSSSSLAVHIKPNTGLRAGHDSSGRSLATHNAENEHLEDSDGVSSAAKRHCSDRSAARRTSGVPPIAKGCLPNHSVVASNNPQRQIPPAAVLGPSKAAEPPKAAVLSMDLDKMNYMDAMDAALGTNGVAGKDTARVPVPREMLISTSGPVSRSASVMGTHATGGNLARAAVPSIDLQRVRASSEIVGSHRESTTGSLKGITPRQAVPRLLTAEAMPHRGAARGGTHGVTPRGATSKGQASADQLGPPTAPAARDTPRGRLACADRPRSVTGPTVGATPRGRQASADQPRSDATMPRWVSSTKTDSKAVTPELTPRGRNACDNDCTPTPRWMSGTKADSRTVTPKDTPRGHAEAPGRALKPRSAAAQSLADSLKRRASLNSLRSSAAQHAAKKRGQSQSSHTDSCGSGSKKRGQSHWSHATDAESVRTRHTLALDRCPSHSACTEGSESNSLRQHAASDKSPKQAPSGAFPPRDKALSPCTDDSKSLSMRHLAASNRVLQQSSSSASTPRGCHCLAHLSRAADSGTISLEEYAAAYRASKRAALQASAVWSAEHLAENSDAVSADAGLCRPMHMCHADDSASLSLGNQPCNSELMSRTEHLESLSMGKRPASNLLVSASVNRYAHASPDTPSTLAARRLPILPDPTNTFSPQQSSPGAAYSDEASSMVQQNLPRKVAAADCSAHAQLTSTQSLPNKAPHLTDPQDHSSVSFSAKPFTPDVCSDEASSRVLQHGSGTPVAESCSSHAISKSHLHSADATPPMAKRVSELQDPIQSFSPEQSSPDTMYSDEVSSSLQHVRHATGSANRASDARTRPIQQCFSEASPGMGKRLKELQDPIQSVSPAQSSPDVVYSDEASSSSELCSQPSAGSRWQGMRMSNSPLYEPSLRGSDDPRPQSFLRDLRRCEEGLKGAESLRESGSTTTEIVWSAAFNACSNPTFCPSFGGEELAG
ncbi:hypothetical protein WJX74_005706 [Apatococcus lobatus]|uniref:Proteophosphoglycan ppg4 n=1 Tax=Apatococcus lobatus TaxID=904363 RepID=A0AAW1Q7N1_9CHLO